MYMKEVPSIGHPGLHNFIIGYMYTLGFLIPSGFFLNIVSEVTLPDELGLIFIPIYS